jgi:nicotinamide-nucleotide amidase
MESAFREELGDDVAGVDVDGLAEVVLDALRDRGQTLATAESCTGGLVGARLTEVPGASDAYLGGVVSYSNQAKETLLGVAHDLLVEHGAVSEQVAAAMAQGARNQLEADWGIGITGVAGPSGGTEEKPVGLVHWAVAGPGSSWADNRVFPGDRSIVREWSTNAALDLLRRRLLESHR